MCFSVFLFSCETEEEEPMCSYESKYPDIPEIQFSVNGENFIQNVNSQSYSNEPGRPELTKIYKENNIDGTSSNFDLYFTNVKFLNNPPDCEVRWNHRITINANIDQRPTETKVYKVDGNPNNQNQVFASYVFENKLPPIMMGNDTNNILTITRFVPQNVLEGMFNITFQDGTTSTGAFNLDLSKDY